jgi:hypothetical protein
MDTPFIFGKIALEKNFSDRNAETEHLLRNFTSGINTILISPRRWGKSSLVLQASKLLEEKYPEFRVIYIDLFNIRTEEEFYLQLAEKTIRVTSSKLQEVVSASKKFFKKLIPRISFSPDHWQEFSLRFDWPEVKEHVDEILNLPEKIAEEKKIKLLICLDEFQNIGYFGDPLAFQKRLRSDWQLHQRVSYCLFGSKRHMLMEVFTSPSMPFYKFGDIIFLEKILKEHWEKFIFRRFEETGKHITLAQAGRIAELVDCHPYYVQQLAQGCWLRTEKSVTDKIIDLALETILCQLSLLFQNLTETLPTTQVNYLRLILDNVSQPSAKANIDQYNLGSSANTIRIRNSLIDKEIIDNMSGNVQFLDPLFKIWMKRFYFGLTSNG